MVNGLGVVGWGVGGIEAEAAMLGQPISMLIPQVLGFRLTGTLPEGATATDLVLTITEMLRKHGVVGKFVEFFGPGLAHLTHRRPRHARQHVPRVRRDGRASSRSTTMTLDYLRLTGRDASADRAGRGVREGAGPVPHRRRRRTRSTRETIELDLATVEPSLAGPRRPQDRVSLTRREGGVRDGAADDAGCRRRARKPAAAAAGGADGASAARGRRSSSTASVVIAAITSCTNTSNPSVMIGAGLWRRRRSSAG